MTIVTTIITCAERSAMLDATVDNLRKTDLGSTDNVVVVMDTSTAETKQQRQVENSLKAIRLGMSLGADLILFLEDDVIFNRHLFHNLRHWKPLLGDGFGMGSLYNPTIHELERNDAEHWFRADPKAVYGSQAFLLSRKFSEFALEHWVEVIGMQDLKLAGLATMGGWDIFYHQPSLVQHVVSVSTWGGPIHTTNDFDGEWKNSQ